MQGHHGFWPKSLRFPWAGFLARSLLGQSLCGWGDQMGSQPQVGDSSAFGHKQGKAQLRNGRSGFSPGSAFVPAQHYACEELAYFNKALSPPSSEWEQNRLPCGWRGSYMITVCSAANQKTPVKNNTSMKVLKRLSLTMHLNNAQHGPKIGVIGTTEGAAVWYEMWYEGRNFLSQLCEQRKIIV